MARYRSVHRPIVAPALRGDAGVASALVLRSGMRWLGYVLGLVVGTVFGFWLHRFWEKDLVGTGASLPPSFDLYVPVALFVVATAALILVGRSR